MNWLLSLASLLTSTTALSCLSDMGSPTDTWLIMKEPHSTSYLYADPGQSLQPSIHSSLNSTSFGALTLTTELMWIADSYIIYNDEDPVNATYSYAYGHTKGYFFFNDDTTEVWIQHSIPQFPVGPTFSEEYQGLTHNAWTNAQQIFCMSLNSVTLNTVAESMLLSRPRVSDWKLSLAGSQFGSISSLATGIYSQQPNCNSAEIQTRGGLPLTVFTKSAEWIYDIWDDCISETVNESLHVQSWLQGSPLGAFCPSSGQTVNDIQSVNFGFGSGSAWDNSVDHSKWGVTVTGSVLCLGDLNRVTSQATRGGGAVCTTFADYAKPFLQTIVSTDNCSNKLEV